MSATRNIAVEFKNRHVSAALVHQIYSQAVNTQVRGSLGAIVIIARSYTKDARLTATDIQKNIKKQKLDTKLVLIEAQSDAEYDRIKDEFHADPAAALETLG